MFPPSLVQPDSGHGTNHDGTPKVSIVCLPDEVLELIGSQLILRFQDVIAFSVTSRRVYEAIKLLTTQPLRVSDLDVVDSVCKVPTSPRLGLIRSAVVDVKFTLAESQKQSDQLRQLLFQAPRLRYLSLRRPVPDPLDCSPRFEPSRSKTSAHPFPLRSSHFQAPGLYLKQLTHLELVGLSIHPLIFAKLPCLTHLKLTLSGQQDAYLATDALNIIAFAKNCKITGFEMSLHVGLVARERLSVAKACVAAWPNLRTLNLLSTEGGRIPSLFQRWQNPEDPLTAASELAQAIQPALELEHLALGIIPLDVDRIPSSIPIVEPAASSIPGSLASLGAVFRKHCPSLRSFRCLRPLSTRPGKRPFTEFYGVARAKWSPEGWECVSEGSADADLGIFGMMG
ncbi:hypothetical protein RhiLY_06107 [Ceratobasidium sp. AG-Ba]|nr:hypothetical protein RhiLY_06107 [Ceratobasidium sp. AG-Ba]